ncbi:hypothetical protein B0H11DRAFT_2184881 [Mycena galericulata]|nr:hypothetical protein B0H11DRAFT_2184881 [Mycena galericulata]
MSFRKDRVRVVAMFKLQLSAQQLEQPGGALDTFLKLPSVEKNLLKFEMTLANGDFDQTLNSLGLQKSTLDAMVVVEAANIEKINEIIREPAFTKIFEGVTQANIFDTSSSLVFSGNFMTNIDK